MTWREALEHLRQSERARRRALASAGICVLLGGMVVAAGLGLLLLALVVVAVSLAAAVTAVRAFVRHRPWRHLRRLGAIRPSMRVAVQLSGSIANNARRLGAAGGLRFARELAGVRRRGRALASALTRVAGKARARWDARAKIWTAAAFNLRTRSDAAATDDGAVSWFEPRVRALQLNSHGAALRREGKPTSAIEQHEQALELVRWTGDRDLEAPTLNSLGLALAAAGETDAAVERFEESLQILRELSIDDQEGKVIANLGLTLLKHGEPERGRELLATALEKLPAKSPAAQRVEVELRRAS